MPTKGETGLVVKKSEIYSWYKTCGPYICDCVTFGVELNLEIVVIFKLCLYLAALLQQSDEKTVIRIGHMDHGMLD